MTLSMICAVLLWIAGGSLGLRQILLTRRAKSFPNAPTPVTVAMFLGAVAQGYAGMLFWGGATLLPGDAAFKLTFLFGMLAACELVMLLNVAFQRVAHRHPAGDPWYGWTRSAHGGDPRVHEQITQARRRLSRSS